MTTWVVVGSLIEVVDLNLRWLPIVHVTSEPSTPNKCPYVLLE